MEKTPAGQTPEKKNRTMMWISGVIIVLAVIAIGWLVRNMVTINTNSNTNTVVNAANTNTVANENTNVTANTNADLNTNTDTVAETPSTIPTGTATKKLSGQVTWSTWKTLDNLDLYTPTQYSEISDPKYFEVGTMKTGTYAGDKLVLLQTGCNCPMPYPANYYFIKHGTGYIYLKNESADLYGTESTPKNSTVNTTITLSDLTYPERLSGPKARQTLLMDTSITGVFTSTGLKKSFVDPKYGQAWETDMTAVKTTKELNPSILDLNSRFGYYFEAPNGQVVAYFLDIDFMPTTVTDGQSVYGPTPSAPNITWTDGTKNTTTYTISDIGGCGAKNYAEVIDPATLSITNDLKKTGTSSKGDAIYEFKDINNPILKDYYTSYYSVNRTANSNDDYTKLLPYTTFVAGHPVAYFVDAFGRLIRMVSDNYLPAVECGKPVIYLYPTKTENVSVKLAPQGGFTKSVPAYNQGWNVTAQPNGHLVDLSSGQAYPYLFWEGRGGMYTDPNKGFVVAQNDVHSFLVSKLAQLGLNATETKDFIEFWEPRMQGSPWYLVSFYGNAMMNQLAPLNITPKPDTIIRILMDFKPLAAPIAVQGYDIKTPARNGFTVVEWGGVIR